MKSVCLYWSRFYSEYPVQTNHLQYGLDDCRMTIPLTPQALVLSDDNLMCGGMNVPLNGTYRKNTNDNIGNSSDGFKVLSSSRCTLDGIGDVHFWRRCATLST